MRALALGPLLIIALAASAQAQNADFRVQARCIAVYDAAAGAVEDAGGASDVIKQLTRKFERTSLALASRRDIPADQNPSALTKAEAAKLKGRDADSLLTESKACDKALGY